MISSSTFGLFTVYVSFSYFCRECHIAIIFKHRFYVLKIFGILVNYLRKVGTNNQCCVWGFGDVGVLTIPLKLLLKAPDRRCM